MSIDKNFTFTATKAGAHMNRAKVCKTAKEYKGACEHCSSDIPKGTFALTADEVTTANRCYGVRTVKTHRLCARCTAEYIASTSTQPVDDTKGESMEFDKNKVLTCVTADQVVVGQRGWFGETLSALEKRVEREPPEVLERVLLSRDRRYIFMTNTDSWSLFYPASEPTYRPYNNDELNDLVGEVLTNKQSGRKKLVTGKPTASEGVNLDGSYINAKDLLSSFYRNGNEPCGVKE